VAELKSAIQVLQSEGHQAISRVRSSVARSVEHPRSRQPLPHRNDDQPGERERDQIRGRPQAPYTNKMCGMIATNAIISGANLISINGGRVRSWTSATPRAGAFAHAG